MAGIYLAELDEKPFPALYEGVLRHFMSVRDTIPQAITDTVAWLEAQFGDGSADGFFDWLHQ